MWTIPLTRSGLSSSMTTSRVWPEETQRRSAVSTESVKSIVTTAGIGVITARASCSWRWKTPPSIPASPASRVPPIRELSMICFRSSAVCFSSMLVGSTPNSRTTEFEIALRPLVTGAVTSRNQFSGRETRRAVRSAWEIASIFGTCSPMLMWIAVTRAKAKIRESAAAAPCERPPKTGSRSFASEGSPRNPIPIEAIVIPTWQAESDSSILSSCSITASAPASPSSASASTLPRRLRTSANSAATKKPLIATRSSSRTSRSALIGYLARYFGGGRLRPFGVRNIAFAAAVSAVLQYWGGMRIASLVPSSTEMLFALGLGERVVAVTHECDYPPEVALDPPPHEHRPAARYRPRRDRRRGQGGRRRGTGALRARRGAAGRGRARSDRDPGGMRRLRGLLRRRARGRRAPARRPLRPPAGPEHPRRGARRRDPPRRGDRDAAGGARAAGRPRGQAGDGARRRRRLDRRRA